MRFGIVVEGQCDAAAYPEIIQKLRDDVEDVRADSCGNDVRLMGSFMQRLKVFQWGLAERPNKAMIIRDSDCREGAYWEERMRETSSGNALGSTFRWSSTRRNASWSPGYWRTKTRSAACLGNEARTPGPDESMCNSKRTATRRNCFEGCCPRPTFRPTLRFIGKWHARLTSCRSNAAVLPLLGLRRRFAHK